MKKQFLFIFLFIFALGAMARTSKKGFAIVIDPKSYEMAYAEVQAYANVVAERGLHVHYLIDRWGIPDSIRVHLQQLYTLKDYPIEGAVFMGDIPIAMVRDAQHMTTAFKMDQETFDWKDSSVPSDRYYDDLHLQFQFIKRDTEKPEYFYYSLAPSSAQTLKPSFYSGRIRPTDCNGISRYDKLKRYLQKVVQEKQHSAIDKVLFFSGNGFISESLQARMDEKIGLYEHFPWLLHQQESIGYIDHKQDVFSKFKLMNELQRKDLDIAFLHHHGDYNIQYLNNLPLTNSTTEQIEAIKLYLRESIRHAQSKGLNLDSAQLKLKKRFDVPDSWFLNAFDSKVIKKDSTYLDDLDLYLSDFKSFKPNCRVVVLDACFNGSFHRDDCIANEYIFSEGNTQVVLANSVNVLQDKWTDHLIGLVGMGMRIGNLSKYGSYLEAHIIGDPTFTFETAVKEFDINEALNSFTPNQWRKKGLTSTYGDIQVLAIEKLMETQNITSKELLQLYRKSENDLVRVACILALAKFNDDNYIACMLEAVHDRYELVSRFALNMLSKSGDERLIPALISLAVINNTSERVNFLVKMAMPMYPKDKLIKEFEKQFATTNYMDRDCVKNQILKSIEVNADKWITPMEQIMNEQTSEKGRLNNIRSMRNYHIHYMVPQLLNYLQTCKDANIQQKMLEAFGWFTLSYRSKEIAAVAKKISQDSTFDAKVREEAQRTWIRLNSKNL